MNKFTLSILLLFIGYFASAQTGYKQKLGDLAAISFPKKPFVTDTLGLRGYKLTDSTALYAATIRSFTPDDFMGKSYSFSQFYDETIPGILKSTKGKLINKRYFEIDGLKGVEIEHSSDQDPDMPDLRYDRIILLNNVAITTTFWTFSKFKEKNILARNKFFGSLEIVAERSNLVQGIEIPLTHKIRAIWEKFSYGELLGAVIIILMIMKIRETLKRKKGIDEV